MYRLFILLPSFQTCLLPLRPFHCVMTALNPGLQEAAPPMLPEQSPALFGAQHPPADQAVNGAILSSARDGAEAFAEDRLRRKRVQDQTELRANASPVPRSTKHQRKGPDSDVQVRTAAARGHLVPDPRPRQDHPSDNRVSISYGFSNARQHHASSGGATRCDETSRLGLLRPQAADDGDERRGRPWSGKGQANEQETQGTHAEVENGLTLDINNAQSNVLPGRRPLCLSGAKKSNGSRGNNDSSMPEISTESVPREKRRRGQRPTSPSASPLASGNDPGPVESAGKRGKVGGTKSSWGAMPGEMVVRTAVQPTPALPAGDTLWNTNRYCSGRENVGSSAEPEQPADGSHSTVSTQNNGHDRFSRDRPGDRYYLPPPQRGFRPRTPPEDGGGTGSSTPRLHEKRQKDLRQWPREPRKHERLQHQRRQHQQQRQRKKSRETSQRGGIDGKIDRSSSEQSHRREARTMTRASSDQLSRQQPVDHRTNLGASQASGATSMPDWRYGWRGPFTTTTSTHSLEEESLPYYMDRKQVRGVGERAKYLADTGT